MSESSQRTGGAAGKPTAKKPRAVVHKRILDVAKENPDAPIATLAEEVSGASPDLVERVLEEYGDPADSAEPGVDEGDVGAATEQGADPGPGGPTVAGSETQSGTGTGSDAARDTDGGPEGARDTDADVSGAGDGDDQSETAESPTEKLTLLNDETGLTDGSDSGPDPTPGSETGDSGAGTGDREPEPNEHGAGSDGHDPDASRSDGRDVTEQADSPGSPDPDPGPADTDEDGVPDPDDLDEKQLAVLRAVRERPTATQKELAASLGVSRATVSKRVNRIEGFDWQDRAAFVDRLFRDGDPADRSTTADGTGPMGVTGPARPGQTGGDLEAAVDELADRVAALTERVDDVTASTSGDAGALVDDPELAHKVVHACFESDRISKDEELRLLRTVLDR